MMTWRESIIRQGSLAEGGGCKAGGKAVQVDIRLTLGLKHLAFNHLKVHRFQSSGFRWVNLNPLHRGGEGGAGKGGEDTGGGPDC